MQDSMSMVILRLGLTVQFINDKGIITGTLLKKNRTMMIVAANHGVKPNKHRGDHHALK